MDMRRHLKPWLNDAELVRLGGEFEGRIASVVEETIRNRFTANRELQPVIEFDGGWRLIPNLTMRAALIERLGSETDNWIGRRVTIFRRRIAHTNRSSGEVRERWVKAVAFPITDAAISVARSVHLGTDNVDDGRTDLADYDDSDAASTPPRRSRD